MDEKDEKILDLLKGNARMSYQELGDALGMSRVAAKKRVKKLEDAGIIRQYNTCIYKGDEIIMFVDIVTTPEKYDEVLEYVATRTAYIRQIYKTTLDNHIHFVAVSDSVRNLKYLVKMIQKKGGLGILKLNHRFATDIIKDVYGGIRYERHLFSKDTGDHEQP